MSSNTDSTIPQVLAADGERTQHGIVSIGDSARAHLGNVYNIYNDASIPNARSEEKYLEARTFYYITMNDRMDQIEKAQDTTCEWVWTTELASWLRSQESLFWVSGKPGSGKSTLMKYLANAEQTVNHLPANQRPWAVVPFFFDFRRGDALENNVQGLLKTLLNCLLRLMPSLLPKEMFYYHEGMALGISELESLLDSALRASDMNLLILIDGLDEYGGDIKKAIQGFLLPLSTHEKVKMCLASRREPVIQQVLGKYPKLHISDPDLNEHGIQAYIQHAIKELDESDVAALQEADIQIAIHEKAEGVFLWVVLALAEIVGACAQGDTADEIRQLLDSLPKDLEEMYMRILNRIPAHRKAEAAVIYTLVANARFRISLDLLRAALYFVTTQLAIKPLPPLDLTNIWLERRLIASLGGLLEVCHRSTAELTESKDGTPEVRLMHETVRSFSERLRWTDGHMPLAFDKALPTHIWSRLCCKAILKAPPDVHKWCATLPKLDYWQELAYSDFREILSSEVSMETLKWVRLLYYSIKFVVLHAERDIYIEDSAYTAEIELAMRSPLSSLHIPFFEQHIASWASNFMKSCEDLSDIVLAITHHSTGYLTSRIARLRSLTDEQRQRLVLGLMSTMSELGGYTCLQTLSQQEAGSFSTERLRQLIDLIFQYSSQVSSVHFCAFLRLGYARLPRFLEKHVQQPRPVTAWPFIEVPDFTRTKRIIPREPPLFIWACEYDLYEPQPGLTAKGQLEVLRSFNTDMNAVSIEGYPILHYLITKHLFEHTFFNDRAPCDADVDIELAIEKLYLLEDAGADFKREHQSQSLVQAMQSGMERLQNTPMNDYLGPLNFRVINRELRHIRSLLEHHEQMGHLPQPQPKHGGTGHRNGGKTLPLKWTCDQCQLDKSVKQLSMAEPSLAGYSDAQFVMGGFF